MELYGEDLKHDAWVCVSVFSPKVGSPSIEQAEFTQGYLAWEWYKKQLPDSISDEMGFKGDESLDTYGKELHQAEWMNVYAGTRMTIVVKRVRI